MLFQLLVNYFFQSLKTGFGSMFMFYQQANVFKEIPSLKKNVLLTNRIYQPKYG